MRYFLLDKVTELVIGQHARGVKNVTLTDEVLHDHFPDHPVLPGALVIEAAAQLGGFLVEMSTEDAPPARAVLTQVDQARFYEPAGPGDQLDIRVRIEQSGRTAARVRADIYIDTRRAGRALLTFVLRRVDSERVHEQRRSLYRLWTRTLSPPPVIR